MAFITIITPTRGRKTLTRALTSLLDQTDGDWVSFVIGDCIPNPQYQPLVVDPRILYWNLKEKKGHPQGHKFHEAGLVRNEGIKLAGSEWLGFVDDDDSLVPEYVSWVKESVRKDMVIFKMQNADGTTWPSDKKLKQGNVGISFAVKTKFVKDSNTIFTNSCYEDWTFIKHCRDHKANIFLSDKVAYRIRH